MPETPSRAEAAAVLRSGHQQVLALVASLSEAEALRTGIGGGEWSVKDLLGHLTSWEEYALAAFPAWREGKAPPIDRALRRLGVDGVNAAAIAAKSSLSHAEVLSAFEDVHGRLLGEIEAVTDAAWQTPATPRARRTRGERLGAMLAGRGAFAHAEAHLDELRAWLSAPTG
jgi:hypothetical protein